MLPSPKSAIPQNTFAFETEPLVKPTGFREYDARWLFGEELNLMGVQALGLGLGTLIRELGVQPEIVVAHEPERLQRKFQRPDLHNAINEAFRIAAQQLMALKQERADHKLARLKEDGYEFRGQIADVKPDNDFGFVMSNDGGVLYFHRDALLVGEFDKLRRGDEVTYVVAESDTGPVAARVRIKVAAE